MLAGSSLLFGLGLIQYLHAQQSEVYSTYQNNTLGFKVNYPSSWNISQSTWGILLHPQGNDAISLGVRSEPSNSTFEEYSSDEIHFSTMASKNTNDFAEKFGMPELLSTISTDRTNISGLDAWRITTIDHNSTSSVVWTVKDNRVYTIGFHSDPIDAAVYEPLFQKIVDSFEIVK
jgi:hypothetical protein